MKYIKIYIYINEIKYLLAYFNFIQYSYEIMWEKCKALFFFDLCFKSLSNVKSKYCYCFDILQQITDSTKQFCIFFSIDIVEILSIFLKNYNNSLFKMLFYHCWFLGCYIFLSYKLIKNHKNIINFPFLLVYYEILIPLSWQ